ncbi:glucosaminidase domain-containing protein [Breznakiellaceae bacterium SP9]
MILSCVGTPVIRADNSENELRVIKTKNTKSKTGASEGNPIEVVSSGDNPTDTIASDDNPADTIASEDNPAEVTLSDDNPVEPIASDDNSADTVASDDNPPDAIANEDNPTDAVASEDNPAEPIASKDNPADAIASDDNPADSVASEANPTEPIASDDNLADTVASDDNPAEPIASEDNPPEVTPSGDNPTDAIASDDNPPDAVASEDNPADTIASEANPTEPIASDDNPADPVASDDDLNDTPEAVKIAASYAEQKPAIVPKPEIPSIPARIIGQGKIDSAMLSSFLLQTNPEADKDFVAELADFYIAEASKEGINHDIAFSQMCLETGFLRFGGLVTPSMNNFCGLGAIDSSRTGEVFPEPQIGVRAHIQHLKIYATSEPLKQELVDPRYFYVKAGRSPTIDGLSGTWARDTEYARKIKDILVRLYTHASEQEVSVVN